MPSCFALLVGINDYRHPVPALAGCRNDVDRTATFLRRRVRDPHVRTLRDAEATRAAVIGAFRAHLGQAGPGDTALFWFSGHGSWAPVPDWWQHRELTGQLQTMLCVDSRHGGVPDLLDKELAVLIAEVAARGAQVVAVLDCCHSGGLTRDPADASLADASRADPALADPSFQLRAVGPAGRPIAAGSLLPELRDVTAAHPVGPPDHVALSASRWDEPAGESFIDDAIRGVFTSAVLAAADTLPGSATYREVFAGAQARLVNEGRRQRPVLFPRDGDLADRLLFEGSPAGHRAAIAMRYLRGRWQLDAGSMHGVPDPAGNGELRLAALGDGPAREIRVRRVYTLHSEVEPVGWTPDTGRRYPMAFSALPVPPMTVAPHPDAVPAGFAEVAAAAGTAGPAGGPSAHIVVLAAGTSRRTAAARRADVTLRATPAGGVEVLDGADTPLTPRLAAHGPADARRVVETLEHIARWRRIRALDNPVSAIAGAVALELVEATGADRVPPPDRPRLRPDGEAIRLAYRSTPAGWTPPAVFVRLRNTSNRPLFCVLLDLTDRFEISAGLLDGDFLVPGGDRYAAAGDRVEFTLPPDRAETAGASVRDWLKLFVAEEEFNPLPFLLPRLGEPGTAEAVGARGLDGLLESLARAAMTRDAGPAGGHRGYDWTTLTISVVTEIPLPRQSPLRPPGRARKTRNLGFWRR